MARQVRCSVNTAMFPRNATDATGAMKPTSSPTESPTGPLLFPVDAARWLGEHRTPEVNSAAAVDLAQQHLRQLAAIMGLLPDDDRPSAA